LRKMRKMRGVRRPQEVKGEGEELMQADFHEFLDRLDEEVRTIWKHISELHCKVAELQGQITVLREFVKQTCR